MQPKSNQAISMTYIINISTALLLLAPLNTFALFGPKSFEECMAKEMKDRDIKQIDIIEAVCYKKFPILKNLSNEKYTGTLTCTRSDGNSFFMVVASNSIGNYKIINRSSSLLVADDLSNHVIDSSGLRLELLLESGIGTLRSIAKPKSKTAFSCIENKK